MNASVCVCVCVPVYVQPLHALSHSCMYVCTAFFIDNACCVQVLYSLFHVQYIVKCMSIFQCVYVLISIVKHWSIH